MLVTKTAKAVINISKLSPTHFVSNICHQYRCSPSHLIWSASYKIPYLWWCVVRTSVLFYGTKAQNQILLRWVTSSRFHHFLTFGNLIFLLNQLERRDADKENAYGETDSTYFIGEAANLSGTVTVIICYVFALSRVIRMSRDSHVTCDTSLVMLQQWFDGLILRRLLGITYKHGYCIYRLSFSVY